jgi:hypothetical protein
LIVIPAQAGISQNNKDPYPKGTSFGARIREDDNRNYILLAPKADGLSITEAYIRLKEYCQQHHFSGGILYYSDDHQRIKLLSYSNDLSS